MGAPASGYLGDNQSGAALIITLACIVILTALILAFLSHTLIENQVSLASADQSSASLFARGAVDSVIGEVKQEIAAGSTMTYPPSGSDIRDPNCIFLPATNQAMVPYRMDAGAPLNVLKRSAYNLPFYAGSYFNTSGWPAPMWAANSSTTNADSSGRAISLARWNEALLMPTANPQGSGSPSTNIAPPASFIAPDWIYITRAGAPVTTWSSTLISSAEAAASNTNCAAGRYAYVVYDESGLLDANAAGYRPSVVTAAMMRHKISEACADLSQIGLNGSDIDALVTWRNPINATNSPVSAYTNYVYGPNTNAFLTPATGERMFTSRQQLINFLIQNVAVNQTDIERMQAALPLLTHFSRELNSPSWYPQINGASGYGYLSLATNSANYTGLTLTNAFTPLARTATAYTDLTNSLVPQPNQPAAFARFPLSRLAWLGPSGPANGATAAQILQSFGLSWDSANFAWKYVGPSGTTVLTSISTLSQVAAAGREPNFFELLKAGILSGSVNVVPQPVYLTYPNPGGIDTRYATNTGTPNFTQYPIPDQQTMQIGMATIDQASTNALPTRIEFGNNKGTNPNNGEDQALYGSKNLPFIYKMVVAHYRPITTPPDSYGTTRAYYSAWAEPVFWSPYLSANTNTAPVQIRIRADSTNAASGFNQFYADTFFVNTDARFGTPSLPCGGPGTSTGVGGTSGATIEMDAANAATLQSATINPIMFNSLLASGAIANPPPINDLRAQTPTSGWTGAGAPANADIYTEGTDVYAGFWMGLALAPNNPSDPHASTGNFNTAIFSHGTIASRPDHQFVLEANYGTTASPRFLEIQRMDFKYFAQSPDQVQEADLFTVADRRLDFFTFNDPRTGRFGFDFMNPTSYNVHNPVNAVTPSDINQLTYTTFPNSANPFSTFIANTPGSSSSLTVLPSVNTSPTTTNPGEDTFRFADNSTPAYGNQNPAYLDADGVQRPGDAWWSSASANTMPMRIDAGTTQYRPVILNRPFYSVGEMGYVYRDMPWRSLDFGTAKSADAGLLDYFCVNDGYAGSASAPVIGGVLNLNTPHPQVLQAMLSGAARAELSPSFDVSSTDATSIANAITNITWNALAPLPLLNKSELATRVAPADPTVTSGSIDSNIKERREALVRALGSAGQVRTWNLMIDVIAQTGRFPSTANGFTNFQVTGEQRYWAHVAIDRYTGQVISLQLEPVSE
jgi:hypothetical protein